MVFIAAFLLFGWSAYRRIGVVRIGRPDNRFDKPGKRLWNMIYYAFFQRKVVSKAFGFNHFMLFWAFMVLLLANLEFLLNGLAPEVISYSRLPEGLYFALSLIFDIVSVLALLAVIIAVFRRLVFPPPHIEARSRDAFVILGMVAALMIAFFGLHASEIAAGTERAASYMPISNFGAAIIPTETSIETLETAIDAFWWIHAIVLLAFLNYLPYSKHMHVLTAIPNCFFRSLEKVRTQSNEEFAKENTYGVGQIDQFTWKGLFDSCACTECGRCSDACPATFTGKALEPRLVIHDIKVNLLQNYNGQAGKLPLISGETEGSVAEEVIWDCTTCGACMEVCPVFIEHVPRIVDMRRYLVEMKAKFPAELLTFFENMEQRSNPWGMAPAERTKWAADIEVKPFEAGRTEYLFYVGCAGAFDSRNRHTTVSLAKILDKSGISWGILGREEMCCGDSLRRLGNEYVFDRMVRANLKMFADKGIRKIITQCPHCYSTLKNDYAQYGANLEVVHHTEFIQRLLDENKLPIKNADELGRVLYHDSCYLGRYNSIFDAPRQVISRTTGEPPAEMERNRESGFCCGGGGGRMWMEEQKGKLINVARVEEALEENPDTICVACPYCMTMFEDGLKDKEADAKVRVLDLAEIVARALPE
ncbi:MAG TPA: (Fe-S)-binding protein [Dehalococcoidia bacterium]|nr:(Fe-S)-binding protein [Dehalococcoidia bacterium]